MLQGLGGSGVSISSGLSLIRLVLFQDGALIRGGDDSTFYRGEDQLMSSSSSSTSPNPAQTTAIFVGSQQLLDRSPSDPEDRWKFPRDESECIIEETSFEASQLCNIIHQKEKHHQKKTITAAKKSGWLFIYNNIIQKEHSIFKNHQQRQARLFGLTALCFL
jgi:hypothetical protein